MPTLARPCRESPPLSWRSARMVLEKPFALPLVFTLFGMMAMPHTSSSIWAQSLPEVSALPLSEALPDPFKMLDGTAVSGPQDWRDKRRPELQRLFRRYMYGYAPQPESLSFEVTKQAVPVEGGKLWLKEVSIQYHPKASPIHLAVFTPPGPGPHPVFLALNACGNQCVLADPQITVYPQAWTAENCGDHSRGKESNFWCAAYLAQRGYALAVFHESDVDPDKHDFTDGAHTAFGEFRIPDEKEPVPAEARWGTIAAWAWGLSRAMDYLVTDPAIDGHRVAVIGHSRRGKTALWAGASDERFALVVPHQSGTGGAALSRNNDQETVERINRVFPHWFNDAFVKFGDNEEQLPFDQHLLIALVAPRPLLETAGDKDLWANYPSALLTLRAADPVYKMLGAPGLVGEGIVREGQTITKAQGNLLQYRQDDKHDLNQRYWKAILDFADEWMTGTP